MEENKKSGYRMNLQKNEFMQKMYAENIPQEMKELPNWVAFKSQPSKTKPGKYDKQLINPNIEMETVWAKANDSGTWASFDKAINYAIQNNCQGVAFALQKNLDFCCIDLDGCIGEDGKINDGARTVLKEFGNTYCEKSISGKGLHVFCKGKLPENFIQRNEIIEMYNDVRFISMTGMKLKYSENKLNEINSLSEINKKYLGERPNVEIPKPNYATLEKDEQFIIDKLKGNVKYNALLSGDFSAFGNDHSKADISLCMGIAFYTRDKSKIDNIFRQSGLYREKWDKGNYGNITIEKAMQFQTRSYNPQEFYGKQIKPKIVERQLGI